MRYCTHSYQNVRSESMDEIDFTLDGQRYQLSRQGVIRAMRTQTPGRIQTYSVDIDGVRFPIKQVLAEALQIPVTRFVSTRAQDLLTKLDFEVLNIEDHAARADAPAPQADRSLALTLAVEFLKTRSDAQPADVVGAASAFDSWL